MKDLKYLASLTIPISAEISFYFKGYWSFFTPFYAFVLIPVLELLLPYDKNNHQGEEREIKKKSKFFDLMLYLNIPVFYGLLLYLVFDVSHNSYGIFELIGIVLSMEIVLGTNGINIAHELGHRKSRTERTIAKILWIPSH